MINERQRVVISGLGVVSSVGIGKNDFWKNIIAGVSGISKISSFDVSSYDRCYGGEVKNFDFSLYSKGIKNAAYIGRSSQMAIVASKLALEDAFPVSKKYLKENFVVCVGTTTGEIRQLEEFNIQIERSFKNSNRFIPYYSANTLSSNVSNALNLSGMNCVFGTACSSGNYAIGYAYDLIRSGKYNYALAGGADAFSRSIFAGFCRLIAVAPERCQPFDKNRKGMIPAEGAGMLCLESLESAENRNAKIYAEILGYGLSCDAEHMTAPNPSSISIAIKKAIRDSQIKIDEVDYISAHGTGTRENDRAECAALENIFGKSLKGKSVSSIKSMLGHTMGAASALEAIVCAMVVDNNIIPPTINFEMSDPECDIDCVPNEARNKIVKIVLNNAFAFGGNNSCLVLKKI